MENTDPINYQPRQTPPSFDEMVKLIERNFKDFLKQSKGFTYQEILTYWEEYKLYNHLWREDENVPVSGQGAIWVKGDYDRLYDQLKAESERKIVCWVNYEWRYKNKVGEILRDICAIMGKVMGFNARGIGYGGVEIWIGTEDEKKYFLEECKRLDVEWLDEQKM